MTPSPSGAHPTPGQTALPTGAPPVRQTTPQPTRSPVSTPSAPPQAAPQDLAAHFLAAYFRWTATQSDQEYLDTWRALVADASVTDLATASPRLTLDNGDDSAASSPTPDMQTSAVASQSGQTHITLTWTIQVLPAGGELVQWQPRRIQATVDLIQNTTGWFITDVGWTSL